MADDTRETPAVHVVVDQRGQQVDRQTNAGRDVVHEDDYADARRRESPRLYSDELVGAIHELRSQVASLGGVINELRNNNANLQTEVALLKFQVAHLNERLRSAPVFGVAQWLLIIVVVLSAFLAAAYIGVQ